MNDSRLIEKYFDKSLTEEEKGIFKIKYETDADFRAQVQLQAQIIASLKTHYAADRLGGEGELPASRVSVPSPHRPAYFQGETVPGESFHIDSQLPPVSLQGENGTSSRSRISFFVRHRTLLLSCAAAVLAIVLIVPAIHILQNRNGDSSFNDTPFIADGNLHPSDSLTQSAKASMKEYLPIADKISEEIQSTGYPQTLYRIKKNPQAYRKGSLIIEHPDENHITISTTYALSSTSISEALLSLYQYDTNGNISIVPGFPQTNIDLTTGTHTINTPLQKNTIYLLTLSAGDLVACVAFVK